jgi:diguanylate cyclase (GGDEF)-like protein
MDASFPVLSPCACSRAISCQFVEAGRLYLWFPTHHTMRKIGQSLGKANLEFDLMQERHGISIVCRIGQAKEVAKSLAELLSAKELQDTLALFIRGPVQPQLHDFSDITSLQRFIKFSQSDWLVKMVADQRFTSHFQPIVHVADTSCIFAYEALLRGLDEQGHLVMPSAILELATEAGLLPQLDRIARLSAIAQANHHRIINHLFINFSPTALYDPVSCLRSTVEAIDQAGIPHDHVVFEVIESDKPQTLDHLKSILKYYRDAGFLIALDDLGSGYSGLNLLHQLRPDFLKLDMELIRNVHQDPYKAHITAKLLEISQKLNIQTVAEGVECTEELNWLQAHGATFAQGYLIARPTAEPVSATPRFEIAPPDRTRSRQMAGWQPSDSDRIVAAVTQRIHQSLDLTEILQATATEVRQLFDADRVILYRFEPDWSGTVVVESVADDWSPILGLHFMDTCFQKTYAQNYQQGHIKAIRDIQTAGLAKCHVDLLQQFQVRANLVVPILQQDRLWGLLIAHQCRGSRSWEQSEIDLFKQLATQAGIAIQQSELYQQLQQANQELQRLASSDGLTQVANRRCFDEHLKSEWQRLTREQLPLSLILCDVDCFKLYNDTYGHLAGDDALRQVAKVIAQTVKRSTGLVARYGGEEFVVILSNTDAKGAMVVAEKIRANISELKMPHVSSQICEYLTLSLGIATVVPTLNTSSKVLVMAADQGLYQAKVQGRNCLVQIDDREICSLAALS